MDWNTACVTYQGQLRNALNVCRHAQNLARLRQAGVDPKQVEVLTAANSPARRQLERLERGEFRIAVVGLEKSGKSTFINAWLESDLLPSDSRRCTFTTTQLFSVT